MLIRRFQLFKNFTAFRLSRFNHDAQSLAAALNGMQFNHCGSHTLLSTGFSPVVGEGLSHEVGDYLLISFSVEKKLLPASIVKEIVGERVAEITGREGARPKRKVISMIKEDVVNELLPKAFCVRKDTLALISPKDGLLIINSATASAVDRFVTAFVRCVVAGSDVAISLLSTKRSPATTMSAWLLKGAAPGDFEINRDCLLKNPDDGASLRFSKHSLGDVVADHVNGGKLPAELALTWRDRVSFTLGSNMTVRKFKLLDVVTEGSESIDDPVAAFNADVMLDAGEMLPLVSALVDAMGGEIQ